MKPLVQRVVQRAAGINWYCEVRGQGPPIVLIPSGEGDCGSFAKVADLLAGRYTVWTFDMPGFSRSGDPPTWDGFSWEMLSGQVAALVRTLEISKAAFYGCSSAGLVVLDLVADTPDLVVCGIVHEVALSRENPWRSLLVTGFPDPDAVDADELATVVGSVFRNGMNDNAEAWDGLGAEYHRRLRRNYGTWVRHYVPLVNRSYTRSELTRRPIVWTVGGFSPIWPFLSNFLTAQRVGIEIGLLHSKHFPQVSAPEELADHIDRHARAHVNV